MDLSARLSAGLTGRYEILREIGRGGMSVVFLARDLSLDREVALNALRRAAARLASAVKTASRRCRVSSLTSARGSCPWWALVLIAGAMILAGGVLAYVLFRCRNCAPPTPPKGLATELEVVPAEVHVYRGEVFTLHVRIRQGEHVLENDKILPGWEVVPRDGSLEVQKHAPSPYVGIYQAADSGTSSQVEVVVRSKDSALEGRAVVRILDANTPSGDLVMTHGLKRAGVPDVALVSGTWGKTAVADSAFALASMADLGVVDHMDSARGDQVAVFSTNRRMEFWAGTWSAAPDTVDFTASGSGPANVQPSDTPDSMRVVPVRLWIAAEPNDSIDGWWASIAAKHQLHLADSVFRMNRAGFGFAAEGPVVLSYSIDHAGCDAMWPALIDERPSDSPARWPDLGEKVIHVVFCESCVGGGSAGRSCCPHSDSSALILMEFPPDNDFTLTHELGHTMGLRGSNCKETDGGHVERDWGFGCRDVMIQNACSQDGMVASFRDHFSLGQIFRMNVDSRSFLCELIDCPSVPNIGNVGHCQDDPRKSAPCPCLAADLLPLFNRHAAGVCP